MKYILKKSIGRPGWWTLADPILGLVMEFRQGDFNASMEMTVLEDLPDALKNLDAHELAGRLAAETRSMTEWLKANCPELIIEEDAATFDKEEVRTATRRRIGRAIRELREEYGLTIRQLAELAQVGHSHIVRIESGKYGVSIDILAQIGAVFGLELDFCEPDD